MNIAGEVQMAPEGQKVGERTDSLLDSFLSSADVAPPTAQDQAASGGGVPLEMQPSTPDLQMAPEPVREAAAVASVQDTGEADDVDGFQMPEDILPQKARREQNDYTQAPTQKPQASGSEDPTVSEADDIMPDEVKRSARRAQDAWTAAKREAKQYKKELEELRKQATTPQNTEEIETLRKQLKEAEDRIGQIDIASSSTFKQQYEAPINDAYRDSVQELVKAGHDVEEAQNRIRALINPSTTREDMAEQLSDLPSLLQGVLYTQAVKMKDMQTRRAQAIQEWRNTQSALREEEQRQSEAIHQQVLVENVTGAIDQLRQEGSFLFSRSDTDDNWNKSVETRIQAARGILTGPPNVLAKYVADGVAAKTYRQLYLRERASVNKLQQDLKNVMSGRPIVGRDSSAGPAPIPAGDRKPRSADSWLEQNLD